MLVREDTNQGGGDPKLEVPEHANISKHLRALKKNVVNWSRIS
jgi:hypothetical protein